MLRVDRDSTSRKDAMNQLFATIQKGQPCILGGHADARQGPPLSRVTLVSILDADAGLFSGDFRASERMAQLIVQVAGRAGRAEEPGKVIIQTHLADHPLLVQLTEQGYFAFAEQALSERRAAGLPPFAHLALLRAEAHKPGQAEGFLDEACSEAERLLAEQNLTGIELLGPVRRRWNVEPGVIVRSCCCKPRPGRRCIDCLAVGCWFWSRCRVGGQCVGPRCGSGGFVLI